MDECPSDEGLAAYAGGELSGARRDEVQSHIDTCSRCDGALAFLHSAFDPHATNAPEASRASLRRGGRVGRYQILGFVGAGAMGAVYSAFDPELKRRVALKTIAPRRGPTSEAERARFVREAQAMATVRHPHVIAVHDAGVDDDIAFFAMEFVEGGTLRQWLTEPRDVAEVIATFTAAGQGLAAAHASGLVHRDFKPDNVLVGDDGRVQVIDFGLARFTEQFVPEHDAEQGPVSQTRTGAVLGTPAYMAPEQLGGRENDARSDQFAFCVALYEGLCAVRPFAGRDLRELREKVGRTPPSWRREDSPARSGRIPRRVKAAIERGLRFEPSERFETMDALLRRLQPRAWGALAGVGGLAIGVAGLAIATLDTDREPPSCPSSESRLAGVWDGDVRARVTAALGPERKATQWLTQRLDEYGAGWVEQHAEACAASLVRREQSEGTMGRRMACLSQLRGRLQATVDVLLEDPLRALERAPDLVGSLQSPQDCLADDVGEHAPEEYVPSDRSIAAALDRARALQSAGRYEDALRALDETGAGIEQLQQPLVELQVAVLRGRALYSLTRLDDAGPALVNALERALAAGELGLASEVAATLVCLNADRGRFEVGEAHVSTALGLVDALGGRHPNPGAVYRCVGQLGHARGEYEKAEEWLRRAVAVDETRPGDRLHDLSRDTSALARTVQMRGARKEAVELHEAALIMTAQALGEEHPNTSWMRARLATGLMLLGRNDEALEHAQKAVDGWERWTDVPTPGAANARIQLAGAFFVRREFDQAIPLFRRGIAELVATVGADKPVVLAAESSLASLLYAKGDHEAAATAFEDLLPRMREVLGADHASVRQTELNSLRLDQAMGALQETIEPLEALVKECEGGSELDPQQCARACRMLGQAMLETRGDWRGAERALALAQPHLDRLEPLRADIKAGFDSLRADIEAARGAAAPG